MSNSVESGDTSTASLRPGPATKKRHWIWKVAGALLVIVLLYVGIGAWVASSMVGNLMDDVKKEVNSSGGSTTDPFSTAYRGDPTTALGYDFDDLMISTPLGDAPAWFVPGQGSTWAILVHGIGGVRENGYRHLSVLQPAGIPTLLITYRNDEGAPKDPSDMYGFGITEWHDLEAAVDYALANGAENVILDGESMGGAIIGQFLIHSDRVDRVAAVVLDAPALDMPIIAAGFIRDMRLPLPDAIGSLGLWIADQRYEVPLGDARSIDAVAAYPGPLFLAHGDHDTIVPITITNDVETSRQGRTMLLRTHAEHIQSWQENPELYAAWLNAFLLTVQQELEAAA